MVIKFGWFMLLGLLMLAACDTQTGQSPSPTVPLPTVIPNTPLPTATNPPNPTLPPVSTIAITSAAPAPTRTLADTITPAPTRTSAVSSLDITPITDVPLAQAATSITTEGTNQLILSYQGDLIAALETLLPVPLDFTVEEGSLVLSFPLEVDGTTVAVEATLDMAIVNGVLRVTISEANIDGEPLPEEYRLLLPTIEDQLQEGLDQLILEGGQAIFGDDAAFVVSLFMLTGDSLILELEN